MNLKLVFWWIEIAFKTRY